jgi:hypothetical protein
MKGGAQFRRKWGAVSTEVGHRSDASGAQLRCTRGTVPKEVGHPNSGCPVAKQIRAFLAAMVLGQQLLTARSRFAGSAFPFPPFCAGRDPSSWRESGTA